MYVPVEKAEMVLRLLLEGNSVSSVERATDVHHTTILKLLVLAGEKCERIMAAKLRNVQVRDVEWDEVWSFIDEKQKRVRPDDNQLLGDCYVFVGIERHSKLVLNIAMGRRDQATTDVFVEGLRHATARTPFQITTDGFARNLKFLPNQRAGQQFIQRSGAPSSGYRTFAGDSARSTARKASNRFGRA
jgi:hypothetical protein